MHFILIVIAILFALDGMGWALFAWLARPTRWRHLLTAFFVAQMIGLSWLLFGRFSQNGWDRLLPKFVLTAVFLWHCLILPLLLAGALLLLPVLLVMALVRFFSRRSTSSPAVLPNSPSWNRRQFLGFAAATVPPLFTISLSGIAWRQLDQFRVRRLTVPLRALPADLDGMTIAHVSDMHVGRFTSGRVLEEMVRVVNELRADFILQTGDLINDALADLDQGLAITRKMESRFGTFLIEGNHDLIEDPDAFERRVRNSGIPFLLDQSTIVQVGGTPVQLLGLSWSRARQNRDQAIAESVHQLLAERQPDAFPILLAHHPHAFDAAAESSIPLILSGHTHGGQLMLNEQRGFGPALFRYWSGLYTKGESNLIVSNGVGNWFPLRTNAPAEIIHITLRRA